MKRDGKAAVRDDLRIVEGNADDRRLVGSAPPLIGRCGHGPTEAGALREMKRIVEEWILA